MDTIHVIEPVKNLTLSISGQKIQMDAARLDYYSSDGAAYVTLRPKDPEREPILLAVAPADKGRRAFGRQGSLRLLGYAAAATDLDEIDPGVMSWTQVCSCNAATLKKTLMALEPVWSEDDLTALAIA